MSRFIFASMGVRNDIIREKLSSKLDTSKRVLIIPCAASNEELTAKAEKEAFCKLGFDRDKIYAFDITKPNKYFGICFDYIYVPGGNQYKLLSEIREHEIDKKIIIPCLEKELHILAYPQVHMLQPRICITACCLSQTISILLMIIPLLDLSSLISSAITTIMEMKYTIG